MPTSCTLFPHPSAPAPWIEALTVSLVREAGGGISFRYTLTGDMERLKIPAPAAPARRDGLWRHTCFELFAARVIGPAYREFNFSPSGAWQAYAFASYREGGPLEPVPAPAIVREISNDRLVLEARLPVDSLPPGDLRLGLATVLEAVDGGHSYWALKHASVKPDFHHPDTFALEIDLRNPQP